MSLTAFRGMRPFSQLLFAAFIVVASFLIFLVASLIVAIPIFGLDSVSSIATVTDFSDPESICFLKYFQVIQSIGAFIVPPFIVAWLFQGRIANYLFLNRKAPFPSFLLVILLIIIASPAINYIGSLNAEMSFPQWLSGLESRMRAAEDKAAELTEAFLNVKTTSGFLFNLFMIALLPALGEELLFRGVVQKIISNWTKSAHWGIWISAALFSALHLQFYGFVPRLLLGVMFGYMLVWSGSMWLPIAAHFANNAAAVIVFRLAGQNKISPEIEEIGTTPESFYLVIISFALSCALLYFLKKQGKAEASEYI